MANKTVSNLNELTTVSNSDVLLVETATETLKVTKGNLLKEVNTQLNTKSNVNHTHDEYVTESELNAKGLATETFVTNKIAEASLSGGDVDLSGYATIDFVTQEIDKTNVQLSELANKGTTVEVLERVTKEEIERQIADGTMANLTIEDYSITNQKIADKTITHVKLDDSIFNKNIGNVYKFKGQVTDSTNAKWLLFTIPNTYGVTTIGTQIKFKGIIENLCGSTVSFERACIGGTSSTSGDSYHQTVPAYTETNNLVSVEHGENKLIENTVTVTQDMTQYPYLIVGFGFNKTATITPHFNVSSFEIKIGNNSYISPNVNYINFYRFRDCYSDLDCVTKKSGFTGIVCHSDLDSHVVGANNIEKGSLLLEHFNKSVLGDGCHLKVDYKLVSRNDSWLLFTIDNDGTICDNEINLTFETTTPERVGKEIGFGYTTHLDDTDYRLDRIPEYTESNHGGTIHVVDNEVHVRFPANDKGWSSEKKLVIGVKFKRISDDTMSLYLKNITAYSNDKSFKILYANKFLYSGHGVTLLNHEFSSPEPEMDTFVTKSNLISEIPLQGITEKHIRDNAITKNKLSNDIILKDTYNRVSYENKSFYAGRKNVMLLSKSFPSDFVINTEKEYTVKVTMKITSEINCRYDIGCGVNTLNYNYIHDVNQWTSNSNYKQANAGETITLSRTSKITLQTTDKGIFYGVWADMPEGNTLTSFMFDAEVFIDDIKLTDDGEYGGFRPSNFGEINVVYVNKKTSTLSIDGIENYVSNLLIDTGIDSRLKGNYISIIGDSISTFANWIPSGNAVYYTGNNCGINSVDQTWWKRTIDQIGLNLCVNNAWSGSRVTTTGGEASAGCMSRATSLHTDEHEPDIIIIYLGINDFNSGVQLGEYNGTQDFPTVTTTFREAYAIMLNKVLTRYPNARLYVCTLPYCERTGVATFPEKNSNSVLLNEWNMAIRELANLFGVPVIEFNKCGIHYQNLHLTMGDWNSSTKQGLHPNPYGMYLMANECVKALDGAVPFIKTV